MTPREFIEKWRDNPLKERASYQLSRRVGWVLTPEEEKAGYPVRPVAIPGHETDLKKLTLTNLYNVRPSWLDNAHKALDATVAKAYGWHDYTREMPDEKILRRLLALNLAR